MSNVKRVVKLSQKERSQLQDFTSKGSHPSKLIRRAQIILALDTSYNRVPDTEAVIAKHLSTTKQTVQNAKRDFLELGMESFLERRKRESPPVPAKVDGEFEAHLIALCCSNPPEGPDKPYPAHFCKGRRPRSSNRYNASL